MVFFKESISGRTTGISKYFRQNHRDKKVFPEEPQGSLCWDTCGFISEEIINNMVNSLIIGVQNPRKGGKHSHSFAYVKWGLNSLLLNSDIVVKIEICVENR